MNTLKIALYFIFTFSLLACNNNPTVKETGEKSLKKQIIIPDFNSDSAYAYVKKQVDFGPRVPNSPEHQACANYLSAKLAEFADTVIVQSFKARAYNGTELSAKNIIGVYNSEKANRVVLVAHWDSRPYADHDPDPKNQRTPIDGANDGASGVGVLMELARHFHAQKPDIGVDIIFFDVEDYGPPQDSPQRGAGEFWGLGSQYWSRNPHTYGYTAKFGILLDMVGANNANFLMEGYSLNYAPGVLKKVWKIAGNLGYGEYFRFEQLGYIDDDHKYMNEILQIPTIDIIHLDDNSSNHTFFEHWHTTNDKLDVISKETLKAVGQTLLNVVYME